MKRERKRKAQLALWTLIFAVLAGLALLLCSRLKSAVKPAWAGGYAVHISEVMTDNSACPSEEGLLWDYVEIENNTGSAFDLGGYYLSDTPGEGKYCFPAGTTVAPNGCLVVWCSPGAEGDSYAPFGLKKEGGETVALMNKNLVSVDEAATVPCSAGQSLIRGENGALVPTDTPTPGFPNTEAGYSSWQAVLASRSGGVLELSEVMAANSLYADPDGNYGDWVELRNPTETPVSLSGYKLSDREEKSKFSFPADRSLGPGEYLVIWCQPGGKGDMIAPFGLSSKGGETLVLTGPSGTAADSVTLPALEKNRSYVKDNGVWTVSETPTPGFSNDEAGLAAWRDSLGYQDVPVVFSELMDGNKACCVDEDGDFSDWIELANNGSRSVDLSGWYLSDTEEEPDKWPIPELVLQPGEYVRLWASGKNRSTPGHLHTGFAISAGETLCLTTPNGVVLRTVPVEELDGQSWALDGEGNYAACDLPTPGFSNDAEGYAAFQAREERASGLLLWEVAVYDAANGDWVELKNVSDETIDLNGYTLTDRKSDPTRMRLNGESLAPGESRVIQVENFGLSANRDEVYLYGPDGVVCDFARLQFIPRSGSYGRLDGENGFFYFAAKTPGADNGKGWRQVSSSPVPDVAPGVYDGVDSLTVSLRGENIHYTTDGSVPTASSPLYTEPLTLSATTVIRAVSLPEGQLAAKPATFSYFINENSSLPIASLVAAPDDLFGRSGIYSHHQEAWEGKWEREASIEFYEDGGSFSIDCGVQIHGRTSRHQSEKRSLKLMFRGRYGGDLNYDVFGDGRVTEFGSLLLRGSLQDTSGGYMLDNLFAGMAMDFTPVPAMNYRYVALYINGEYWGIYSFREHHNEDFFASHYGVDPDSVQVFNGEYRYPGTFSDLLTYAENHDLNSAESWQYIQEHLDVEEMIDWVILECYGGDIDVYENVRFYSSPEYENNKVLYGLVDMDLCMSDHQTYALGFECWPQLHAIIPRGLMYNPEFRDMFLSRLGSLLKNELSDAAVLARIQELRAQVEPESARDLARWGHDASFFASCCNRVTGYVDGRAQEMINSAYAYFGLSAAEGSKYFG